VGALGPFWTGRENLALSGIHSPDRRARSELQYRLRGSIPLKHRFIYTQTHFMFLRFCDDRQNLSSVRFIKGKVKVKVKFTSRTEQATKAQRGSRDIAILFL